MYSSTSAERVCTTSISVRGTVIVAPEVDTIVSSGSLVPFPFTRLPRSSPPLFIGSSPRGRPCPASPPERAAPQPVEFVIPATSPASLRHSTGLRLVLSTGFSDSVQESRCSRCKWKAVSDHDHLTHCPLPIPHCPTAPPVSTLSLRVLTTSDTGSLRVPQCLNRVELRRCIGRVDAEDEPRKDREPERDRQAPDGDRRLHPRNIFPISLDAELASRTYSTRIDLATENTTGSEPP